MMKKIREILQDSSWGAISAFAGVVAVFFMLSPLNSTGELSLFPCCEAVRLGGNYLPPSLFELHQKGKETPTKNLQIQYFYLMNTGSTVLTKDDFVQPLSLKSIEQGLKILLTKSCVFQESNNLVSLGWTKQGDEWMATPSLLNKGDLSCIAIYVEGEKDIKSKDFMWTSHIKNAQFNAYSSKLDFEKNRTKSLSDYFEFIVFLSGFDVYWFFILLSASFLLMTYLAKRAEWIGRLDAADLLKILLIVVSSTAFSEVLVYISAGHTAAAPLHPLGLVFVGIHCLFILFLFWAALKKHLEQSLQ